MKKNYYVGMFAVFLMACLTFPAGAQESLMHNYGVSVGDKLEYNISTDFNINIDDDSITAINQYLSNMPDWDQDFGELLTQINNALDMAMQIQFTISKMNHTEASEFDSYKYDDIYAEVLMRDQDGDPWTNPYIWASNTTIFQEFSELMGSMPSQDFEMPPYEDQIGGWEVDTEYVPTEGAPEPPMEGNPNGMMVLPTNMKLSEWYEAFLANMEWEIDQCEGNDCPDIEDVGSYIAASGISLNVVERGIAVSFALEDVDFEKLGELTGGVYGDLNETLSEMGISSFSGGIQFGLEYDNNMNLKSIALYVDGSITLTLPDEQLIWNYNSTGDHDYDYVYVGTGYGYYSNETIPLPDIENGVFGLDMSFTMAQFGSSAPSRDDIAAGKIGEAREGIFGAIPGYPMGIFAGVALISVYALIKKRK